jgi:hypothetical protein
MGGRDDARNLRHVLESQAGRRQIERIRLEVIRDGSGIENSVFDAERSDRLLSSSLIDHLRRDVDADDLCPPCGDLTSEVSGPAAEVEDSEAVDLAAHLDVRGTEEAVAVVVKTGPLSLGVCIGRFVPGAANGAGVETADRPRHVQEAPYGEPNAEGTSRRPSSPMSSCQ